VYTNIQAKNVTIIIRNVLNNHTTKQNTVTEIVNIAPTILSQNYFQFTNEFYRQEGLAMGAPSFIPAFRITQ
jgi:hypothetical protein